MRKPLILATDSRGQRGSISVRWARLVIALAVAFAAVTPALAQDRSPAPSPVDNKKDELKERLIRKAVTQSEEGPMERILRMMEESQERLELNLDSGKETQALQDQILARLDESIKASRLQSRSRSASSTTQSDKRRMSKAMREKPKDPQAKGGAADPKNDVSTRPGDQNRPTSTPSGELRELRRGWGQLPSREREEVLQGAGEGYLERYRAWIERYYRALQETDQ